MNPSFRLILAATALGAGAAFAQSENPPPDRPNIPPRERAQTPPPVPPPPPDFRANPPRDGDRRDDERGPRPEQAPPPPREAQAGDSRPAGPPRGAFHN